MEVHAVLQGGGRLCLGSGRRTNHYGRTLASLSAGKRLSGIGLSGEQDEFEEVATKEAAMEDRSPNIVVVRSVWRRVKKAKIRDLGIRDLEPVKDVKGGGGDITDKSKPSQAAQAR